MNEAPPFKHSTEFLSRKSFTCTVCKNKKKVGTRCVGIPPQAESSVKWTYVCSPNCVEILEENDGGGKDVVTAATPSIFPGGARRSTSSRILMTEPGPFLNREVTTRYLQLSEVGLEGYRDLIVKEYPDMSTWPLVLKSRDEMVRLGITDRKTQAAVRGMLLDLESVTEPKDLSDLVPPGLQLPNGGECIVCYDDCLRDELYLSTCQQLFCLDCVRGRLKEEFCSNAAAPKCPCKPSSTGHALPPLVIDVIMRNRCSMCMEEVDTSASSCPAGHTFCDRCLLAHLEECAKRKEEVRCPRFAECFCTFENSMLERVLLPESGNTKPDLLHELHAQKEENSKENIFHRKCPNAKCGRRLKLPHEAVVAIKQSVPRTIDMAAITVACPDCERNLCALCWDLAHPGRTCNEAATQKKEWMELLQTIDVSELKDEVRKMRQTFKALQEDEAYKASAIRLCPNCGVQCLRTDGCDSVTCGSDAPDKGGRQHFTGGCGEVFDWARAEPYVAKLEKLRGAKMTGVQHFGHHVGPARVCAASVASHKNLEHL